MSRKEFLTFLISEKKVPEVLKAVTEKDILLSFKKNKIILSFLGFQLLGALFSMSVCPQFGMGLVSGHGITHTFRLIGDWACAAFCGTVFLSSGMLVAFLGMKGEELWWIWRRYKITLVFLPALLWSLLMLTNVSFDLPSETPFYHAIWIVVAMVAQGLWFQLRGRMYLNSLRSRA